MLVTVCLSKEDINMSSRQLLAFFSQFLEDCMWVDEMFAFESRFMEAKDVHCTQWGVIDFPRVLFPG